MELTFWGHEIIKRVCPFLSLFRWRSYRGAVDCTFRVSSFQKTESEFHVCSSVKYKKNNQKISLILFHPNIYIFSHNKIVQFQNENDEPSYFFISLPIKLSYNKSQMHSSSLTHFLPVFLSLIISISHHFYALPK